MQFRASQIAASLGNPIAFAARLVQRIRERREMNRILGFPDYLLTDIGLRRDEMQRKALGSLWREQGRRD